MIVLEIMRITTGAIVFLLASIALGELFNLDWPWLGIVVAGWLICCAAIAWLFCCLAGGE
ncbi:hypothetical protein [Martelella limonii]|uniref:hypothetical protein n=1 Tax=Martelella limonii TaxID=1647649 RepID=UPI001580B04B|nr:hypothetical protein [Martelella limonii]